MNENKNVNPTSSQASRIAKLAGIWTIVGTIFTGIAGVAENYSKIKEAIDEQIYDADLMEKGIIIRDAQIICQIRLPMSQAYEVDINYISDKKTRRAQKCRPEVIVDKRILYRSEDDEDYNFVELKAGFFQEEHDTTFYIKTTEPLKNAKMRLVCDSAISNALNLIEEKILH